MVIATIAAYVVLALMSPSASGTTGSQDKPPARPFVAGEVIVKFSPTSGKGTAVARAAEKSETPGDEVAAEVAALAKELGVPIEAKRLGSGGTVLLSLRTTDLAEWLATRLRSQRIVKEARTAGKESTAGEGAVQVDLVSGSPEASKLAQATGAGRETAATDVARKLEQSLGIALAGEVDASGKLVVSPELRRYTLEVIERLKKRSDVEYAQPNYTIRPLTGASR
jgi:hypothetical protein